MAIIGTPIANGDGSYAFQQDDGSEPLILRGDAAERAFAQSQGAAPSAAPPSLDPSIVAAATDTGPDRRTAALNAFGEEDQPGNEFEAIRAQGMARPAAPVSAPDTRGSFAKGMDNILFGIPTTPKEAPRDIGDIDADQPQPGAAGGKGGGPRGGVFYTPPAAQDPNQGLRYVPGGMTPHSRTEQGSLPMSDANEVATKKADQGRYEAAEGLTQVAIDRATEEARVRGEMATASMAEEARQQAAETERRQAVETRLQKLDKMGQDAASEKIDPDHYWADKDASFKFETSLFAGLSAFAASRSGGKAYAVDSLNDAIARDERAQDKNLQNKRASIAQETNFLGELRNEYKDRDAASAAFKVAKLGTALAKLDEIAAHNLPAEQKAKLEETRATIMAQRQDQRNALGKVDYANTAVNVPGGYVGGRSKKDQERMEGLAIPDGEGGQVQARSDVEAREIRKAAGLTESATEATDRMAKNAQNTPLWIGHLDPKVRAEAERQWALDREVTMNALNTMSGQGVVRDDDVKRWKNELLGEPGSIGAAKAAKEIGAKAKALYASQVRSQMPAGQAGQRRALPSIKPAGE